jgi:O-antigen ligase
MFPHVELFSSRLRSFLELGASNASRVCLAISGLWMFRDHPLFGVGIGSFSTVYERSYVHPAMPVVQITKSHTLPVQVLAELGIIGFLLLVWFCYAIIREGLLAIKDIRDPYLRALEVGLVAVFLALMVNSLFNNHLGDNFLWVTIGLIFATRRADRYESLRSRESRQPRCPCAPGGLRVAARRTPQDAA